MKVFQYILLSFLIVCAISVSFSKKLFYHMDLPGIAGSCNYRGRSRGGDNERALFCHVKKDPCH